MQGKVEICGVNTSKLQTLSNAEMMRLIERSQQGDMDARSRLVEGNLKLVLSVVQRFLSRGENPDDLFQVGCIGLLKAIANFDTTKNVRFSTYGVPMIAGELRRYLRDYSPIRVSRSLRDTAYRVLQCRQQLTDQNGREPSIDEIAQALDLPPAQITAALDAITAPVSLYEPVYSEGGDALTVMDQVRDRKNTDEQWIESITLREAISHLSEREKRILALRFEAGRTQMEVACDDEPVPGAAGQGSDPCVRGGAAGVCERSGGRYLLWARDGADRAGAVPVSGAVRPGGRLCDPVAVHQAHRRRPDSGRRAAFRVAHAAQEAELLLSR